VAARELELRKAVENQMRELQDMHNNLQDEFYQQTNQFNLLKGYLERQLVGLNNVVPCLEELRLALVSTQ
jgi:hypothetical protein